MPDLKPENQIIDALTINKMIRRMAFEIYEDHFEEETIYLAGVAPQGFLLAQRLKTALESIAPIKVHLIEVRLKKTALMQPEVTLSASLSELSEKAIVLVDDVLNTAKTTAYALAPFLNAGVKSIKTAILVDRSHHQFPIASNYSGYALSTTIGQEIRVKLDEPEKQAVYLF